MSGSKNYYDFPVGLHRLLSLGILSSSGCYNHFEKLGGDIGLVQNCFVFLGQVDLCTIASYL